MTDVYMVCAHCGCEFLPSRTQAKRARRADYSGKSYCSLVCQMAAMPRRPATVKPFVGMCRQCGKEFTSKYYAKTFCTMKCYIASPEFQRRIREQAPRGNAARILKLTGELPQPKLEITCLNCGTKKIVKYSKKHEKYCNRRCYREYMMGRFDRWIASPQSIALPQAYDEFLSQNELPCLIEGCEWIGKHLGNHVNFAHGISVEEFKRAAGFNKKTGLVTPAVATALSERPHLHDHPFGGRGGFRERSKQVPPAVRSYRSLEGNEHQVKAMALLACGPSSHPPRVCQQCGKDYQPGPLDHSSKYCSIPCRTTFYYANYKNTRFWLQCATCLKDFQGFIEQKRREEKGLQVYCSPHCRGVVSGKLAGAARHRRYLERIEQRANETL